MVLTLVQLARKTLESYFEKKIFNPDSETKKFFSEKKACFVTLTERGEIRGCMGSLYPRRELWKEVQENAINSSIRDPRFMPLTKDELTEIKIEVSILSKPQKIIYKSSKDLLSKINSGDGIILQKNGYSATFLPQVWKQIPNKIEFLEELSMKAGLNKDAWKDSETEFWVYSVKIEKEE